MKQTKEMRHYLNQIKKLIPSDYTGKREILQTIEWRIMDYLEEHPHAAIADFEREFGTPEEVADSFLDELSGSTRERKLRRKNKWLVVTGCALMIIGLLLVRYTFYLIKHTAVNKTETLTIYTNEPDPWEEEQ